MNAWWCLCAWFAGAKCMRNTGVLQRRTWPAMEDGGGGSPKSSLTLAWTAAWARGRVRGRRCGAAGKRNRAAAARWRRTAAAEERGEWRRWCSAPAAVFKMERKGGRLGCGRAVRRGRADLWLWAKSEAAGLLRREALYLFIFQIYFPKNSSNSNFEQVNDVFSRWPKNKSCIEFNSLQLCLKDQLKIPNRFRIGI
jgi:hypothetical protein